MLIKQIVNNGISKDSPIIYCSIVLLFKIKIVFSNFKIRSLFGIKDPIHKGLRCLVVYKFICSSCGACYVTESNFLTYFNEHLKTDKTLHYTNTYCFQKVFGRNVCLIAFP